MRTKPSWYLPLTSTIMKALIGVLRSHNPGLVTLKAFPCTASELDSDGIHLGAVAGRDYVQFLLDQPMYV